MNVQHAPTAVTESRESYSYAQLQGRWLLLARVGWVALVVFHLVLSAIGLPLYFASLRTICVATGCPPWHLTSESAHVLGTWGFSVDAYAVYMMTLQVLWTVVFWTTAVVLFWRKSTERLALFVSLTLVLVGTLSPSARSVLFAVSPALGFLALFWASLGWASFFTIFFCLFPNGRFVPRWTWLLAVVFYVVNVPAALPLFFKDSPLDTDHWPSLLVALAILLLTGSGLVAQIYRYRRVSTPMQRQQTKWIIFTLLSATGLFFAGTALPNVFSPPLTYLQVEKGPIGTTVDTISFLPIALALGIAMLRYRLWDIDVLINRTLVYGTLTVMLALVYFGLIIGLQALLRGIISQDNGVAIVISTLAIAALFQPLRQRIQRTVDRRFYRSKYDAAKIIEAFSATLRNEVDLDQLREQLLAVVQETMQPAHISLWLRPPESSRTGKTQLLSRIDEIHSDKEQDRGY